MTERRIEELVEELVGAARESWIEKWKKWMDDIIDVFNIDPAEIGYNPDIITDFLLEHCHGLTESECVYVIEKFIREHGGRKTVEQIAESMEDYITYLEKDPKAFCVKYGFSPDVCDKLVKIRDNPCLDRTKAREVLKEFLMVVSPADPEFVESNADEIAKEIVPEGRCISWDQVLVATSSALRRERERQRRRIERTRRPSSPKEAKSIPLDTLARSLSLESRVKRLYMLIIGDLEACGRRNPGACLEIIRSADKLANEVMNLRSEYERTKITMPADVRRRIEWMLHDAEGALRVSVDQARQELQRAERWSALNTGAKIYDRIRSASWILREMLNHGLSSSAEVEEALPKLWEELSRLKLLKGLDPEIDSYISDAESKLRELEALVLRRRY